MLVHLSIRDFAIIDALELALTPGMTALTGETGAGKSILVEALTLLLGERAKAEVIRAGRDDAEVAGQFALSGACADTVAALLASFGLPPCDDGALVLRRVVSRAGRHRQFVNGGLATVAQLKAIAEPLVDSRGSTRIRRCCGPAPSSSCSTRSAATRSCAARCSRPGRRPRPSTTSRWRCARPSATR
jgi:DNA repair protein RecN (Recombination protein N)